MPISQIGLRIPGAKHARRPTPSCRRLPLPTRATLVAPALFVALSGCDARSNTPGAPNGVIRRDSAGIEIVELGPIDDRVAFRLAEEPEYVVGWGPNDYQFHIIRSGSLDSAGRALLADGGSRERIVITSPSGGIERLLGGSGSGPGEFGYINSAHGYHGESVIAQESIGGMGVRITFFEGPVAARTVPTFTVRGFVRTLGIDREGGIILVMTGHPPISPGESWVRTPVMRFEPTYGRVDTLFTYDRYGSDTGEVWGSGAVASLRDGLAVARSDRPSIRIVDHEGVVQRDIRWEEPFPTGDAGYWELYADALSQIELHPDQTIGALVTSRQSYQYHLKYFPAPSAAAPLIGDDVGNVWMAESTPYDVAYHYPRYRVFTSSGQWLGWVEIPERSHILAVRDGKVLLQRYDEYRVPAVALYCLEEVQ